MFPRPKKPLKSNREIEAHMQVLFENAMSWMQVSGYKFWILLPGEEGHDAREDAAMSVVVEWPYRRFKVHLQQSTIDAMLKAKLTTSWVWEQVERSCFHEITHVLLWELSNKARMRSVTQRDLDDAEENVVDLLSFAFHDLLKQHRLKKK